ncbi:MAG: hypothetical protein ACKOUD_05350, partial [Rhodoluna sp.]
MILLKSALYVILELALFASLGNGNFSLATISNALFFLTYFAPPLAILRCAFVYTLFTEQTNKAGSLDFWKNLLLFIGPCIAWATYGFASGVESWGKSWINLSLIGYLACE